MLSAISPSRSRGSSSPGCVEVGAFAPCVCMWVDIYLSPGAGDPAPRRASPATIIRPRLAGICAPHTRTRTRTRSADAEQTRRGASHPHVVITDGWRLLRDEGYYAPNR